MPDSPPPIPPQTPPNQPYPQPPRGRSGVWILFLVLGITFGVIIIIGILASIAMPAYNGIRQSGLRTKSVNNIRQINLALRIYSTDHDGLYPAGSNGTSFSSSQDAFNTLLPDYIDSESVFWISTREPNHRQLPNENGTLEEGECVYGYVAGQTETSPHNSPLVFEGFLEGDEFRCTEYMPWLQKRKAMVGFVDGSVAQMPLTTSSAGATICSHDRSIKNIFETQENGGYLATEKKNILLPEGY